MRQGKAVLVRARSEIVAELEGLEHLLREHGRLPVERSDPFLLRARASMLHDLYTGVERILIKIAEELGGGIPRSEQWHRDLLRSMAMELPDLRPAVFSRELHDLLVPYLRFRHFFRNVYGYVLDESRLDELDAGFDAALARFQDEMLVFLEWMDTQIAEPD